ncbi:MAG: type II secretion system protein [Anaerolineae bacterium]
MKDSGFTLLELLIVIAIIALLVGIVALNLNGFVEPSRAAAMQREREIVLKAIDVYETQDVESDGAAPIPAQGEPATILAGGTVPFSKYLKGNTVYTYTWDEDGKGLEVHE